MNSEPRGTGPQPVAVLGSIVLGLMTLFFGFGGVGFAVISLAAVAGKATGSELMSILGISLFCFLIAGVSLFGIFALNRRR